MSDPYARYDWLQNQGQLAISLALLDASAAPAEGLWLPTMFLTGGSIEVTGTFSALSMQLYGTNAVAPLNTQTVTIGGSIAANDVIALNFYSPGLPNGVASVSYTAVGGDTTTTIAAALTVAIGASALLQSIGLGAVSAAAVITVSYGSLSPSQPYNAVSPTSPGVANTVRITGSSTGSETVAVANGSSGTTIGSAITAVGLTALTTLTRWMKMRVVSLTGTSVSAYLHGHN